ncbi:MULTISPECIES: enoyl-CoA hydratase/isomerase family protein [Mycobacterium]|uniref:enoyl-CoA hydratase/isomerase family protein n=1 Tax=Mycobacterium TaxID=1763 RepID=UPI00061819EF|nr:MULTISPECIES: enoyl-CoA hydratase/isomerase family protein [Mycobacterium]KKC06158.1 enoyl-CoA hydratase [Mycobacterium nebraskense]
MSGRDPSCTDAHPVVVDHLGSVACVTLARAEKANAMDAEITDALLNVVLALRDDPDVHAMVLTGQGDAFSAGGDFETIRAMRDDRSLRDTVLAAHQELFWAMTRLPFPTVAAVNGAAVGAGVTVALLCDLVVMAEDTFFSDPRVSLGLLDGAGGLLLWPLLTSLSAAKEHLLLGDRVSGVEAHRLGLANRAVPASEVLGEALQLAERLAALPPRAVQQARQLLNFHIDRVAAILPHCARAESECFDTEEHRVLLERLSARVATKKTGTP